MKRAGLKRFVLYGLSAVLVLATLFGFASFGGVEKVSAATVEYDLTSMTNPGSSNRFYSIGNGGYFWRASSNHSYSSGKGIKTQNSQSGIVFSVNEAVTATFGILVSDKNVGDTTVYVKSISADDYSKFTSGTENKTTVTFTATDYDSVTSTSSDKTNKTYEVAANKTLVAGNYFVYATSAESNRYFSFIKLTSATVAIEGISGYTYNQTASAYEASENVPTSTTAETLKGSLPRSVTGTYGESGTAAISVSWNPDGVTSGNTITFTGTMTAPENCTLASTTIKIIYTLTDEKTAVGTFEDLGSTVMVGSTSADLPATITDGNGVTFAASWSGNYDLNVVGEYVLTASVNAADYPLYDFTDAQMPRFTLTVAPKTAVVSENVILQSSCGAQLKDLPATISAAAYYGETALNESVNIPVTWDEDSYDETDGTIDGELTAPDGYVFDDGSDTATVTAKVKITHTFDDDKETSVCSACHKVRRTNHTETAVFDTKGHSDLSDYDYPDGWELAVEGNTKSGDGDPAKLGEESVCPIALSNESNNYGVLAYEFEDGVIVNKIVVYAGACSDKNNSGVRVGGYDENEKVIATTAAQTVTKGKTIAAYTFDGLDWEAVASVTVENTASTKLYVYKVEIYYQTIEPTGEVTVTLDVDGGNALEKSEYTVYAGDKITLPTATKDNAADGTAYNFMGWTDGENTYKAGAEYVATDSVKLTAVWSEVGKGTRVTTIQCESSVSVMVGAEPTLPTTAIVFYDGGSATVPVTKTGGTYDKTVSGVYDLTFTLSDEGGLYDLGSLSTFTFTVYVCRYKITDVADVFVSVKVGGTIAQSEVAVTYVRYAGETEVGDQLEATLPVTWDSFDSATVGTYEVNGTLSAGGEWDLSGIGTVTAHVEVYDFDESGINTVYINSSNVFNALAASGYTVSGQVTFDNGSTDAFLGAKLAGGGKVTFTLNKTTHVILGVSSTKASATVNFYKDGDVDEAGAQKYLKQITSFSGANYQTIDMTLEAGTYVLENGASGDSNNFSLTYVVVDDGGQDYFIPTAGSSKAPANTDKDGFGGWYFGDKYYTVGADMPVATRNKDIIMYKANYYIFPEDYFDAQFKGMYALGWLYNGTAYYQIVQGRMAGEWTALYAGIEWVDGAALRIAGASTNADEDNSAIKFRAYITLSGNYAESILRYNWHEWIGYTQPYDNAQILPMWKVAAPNKIECNVYIEKIASSGMLKTELYAGITFANVNHFRSNAFAPAYIASKALADFTSTADDTHKFAMEGGKYSYFNDEERTELNKYVTVAATQQPVEISKPDDGANDNGNSGANADMNTSLVAMIASDDRKDY